MFTDLSALYFSIPARDALGREHVEGKLLAAESSLQFFWRFRDRTFKRVDDAMTLIEMDYANVESVILHTTFFRFRPRLVLKLSDPRPLKDVPGTDVGLATLMLTGRDAINESRAFIKLVSYRQSDAEANARIGRLSELEKERGL